MKLASLLLVAVLVCAALSASAAQQAPDLAQNASDFERNTALGAALDMRAGTQAEFDEVRLLGDRGLKAAQAAVAADPESAGAQYALGSWLLYGYHVAEVDQITFDTEGNAQTERVTRVVQGMSDDPAEGLAALDKATKLAPANGQYLLDYAAALMDYDRVDEAETILKGAWAGKPELSVQDRMRAGLLLSTIAEDDGDLDGAREWIYSALSLDQLAAPAVDRLREIDAAALEAAMAMPSEEPGVSGEAEGQPGTVEGAPSEPEAGAEQAPSMEEGTQPSSEESGGEAGAAGGEQLPSEAGGQEAPQEQNQGYDEGPGAQTQGEGEIQPPQPPTTGY